MTLCTQCITVPDWCHWLFVVIDGAEYSHIGLPEEMERRLRFATPTVAASKAQKHHGGKKKSSSSEQVCRQKGCDGSQKNVTESAQSSTLVFMSVAFNLYRFPHSFN